MMAAPLSRRLDFSEIPVIDSAPGDGNAAQLERTVAALDRACSDVGFIYIRNHGVFPRSGYPARTASEAAFQTGRDEKDAASSWTSECAVTSRSTTAPMRAEARAGTSHQEGFDRGTSVR